MWKRSRLPVFLLWSFFLFCSAYYLGQRALGRPVAVTVQRPAQEEDMTQESSGEDSTPGGYPQSLISGERININTAPAQELERLPGIGEKRALALVAWREEHGPFTSTQQLLEVEGVGEAILEGLKDYIVLE